MENREELAERLQAEIPEGLRAVVSYETTTDVFQDSGQYQLLYLESDTEETNSRETDAEAVMASTGMESLGRTIREHRDGHEELVSVVKTFAEVTEVYFFLGEGEGVALALDPDVFISGSPLMDACLDVLDLD
ncbi:hypothetical protein ACFO0N_03615 [Halobium salinum]|uniref:Roadblock/LAMTOR2 domain-containing protein n=1 Tax=Halobium salinum TaxID=1364940 RepID=A0ABD5P9A4_9EURY|nr:hypothetical protein [Halobium salinum]